MKTKRKAAARQAPHEPSVEALARYFPVLTAMTQQELRTRKRAALDVVDQADFHEPPEKRAVWRVLCVAGLIGWLLGLGCGWQIAVESAQVVAGTVSYPIDNPFYMYHVKTWTLLHQIPAVFLWLGAPEQVVSLSISGFIGMVSIQSIALCGLAISKHGYSAFLPVLFLTSNACTDASALYPVQMLPHDPWLTYGVLGAALAVGSWSLVGLGWVRSGAFLMGLAPAFHPALGAWAIACGAAGQLWGRRAAGAEPRRFFGALAAGIAVTLVSLAAHVTTMRPVDAPDAAEAARLVASFTDAWDSHRGAYPLDFPAPMMAVAILALSWVALAVNPSYLSPHGRQLVRILAVSAGGGLALAVLTLWQDRLPAWLVAAMPGRYINLVGFIFPSLLCALLAAHMPGRPAVLGLFVAMIVALGLRSVSLATSWFYVPPAYKMMLVVTCWFVAEAIRETVFLWIRMPARTPRQDLYYRARALFAMYGPATAALALAARWFSTDTLFACLTAGIGFKLFLENHRLSHFSLLIDSSGFISWIGLRLNAAAVLAIIGAVWGALGWLPAISVAALTWLFYIARPPEGAATAARANRNGGFHESPVRVSRKVVLAVIAGVVASIGVAARAGYQKLGDWRSQTVYAAAQQGEGLLLTCARMRLIQLRTQRPLVISCFGINQITYVPESAPGINRALVSIYGEDLAAPRPADWRRCGGLPEGTGRELWEKRTPEEWRTLAREFGFTQVIAFRDWQLNLPLVAEDDELKLYSLGGD